jgi:hypothetical protein
VARRGCSVAQSAMASSRTRVGCLVLRHRGESGMHGAGLRQREPAASRAAPPRIDRDEKIEIAALCRTPPGEKGLHATAARCGRSKAAPATGSECVASSKRCSTLFHSTIHAPR